MKSVITEDFLSRFAQLPSAIKQQAREAYKTFKKNPNHLGLRYHKVTMKRNKRELHFVSIGIHYRALAQEKNGLLEWFWNGLLEWFWIGHHTIYDKLLDSR